MTGSRRVAVAALLSLLVMTGCASGEEKPHPGASGAGTSHPEGPAGASTTPTPTATPIDCPPHGAAVIPDGTWDGPVTLDVTGVAGLAPTKSSGSGELHAVVQGGKVVQGTWRVTWHSVGHGTTNGAEATVALDAEIAGNVKGAAAEPVVHGAWSISGTARFTEPVTATVPVAESGQDNATITVKTTDCDTVIGTFVPSFNTKNAMASFSGTARWVGHRVD